MSLLRILLFPISLLYFLYQFIRNKLYDLKLLKSHEFDIPIISVGNLSVGGTGKTPLVNYIISILKNDYKIGFLSRGYGRDSTGYFLANETSNVIEIGDEPYLIKRNHKGVTVAVAEKRVIGIKNTIERVDNIQMFVLDDAFQHRNLKCSLNIVLSKFSNPYYNDFVLPTGNLREPKSGIKRAQIIIISKCPPELEINKRQEIIKKIAPLSHQKVFFTTIDYNHSLKGKDEIKIKDLVDSHILLVTGIADSSELEKFLKKNRISFDHLKFNDHHKYSDFDINTIKSKSLDNKVVTTKKDYYKIINNQSLDNIYYIDIKVKFLNDENNFKSEILNTFK